MVSYELKMELEEALRVKYEKLGVKINTCYPVIASKPEIYEVCLDFTDTEWVDLCQAESELLPSCCSEISAMRDILVSSLRNGKVMSMRDLVKFYRLAENHGYLQSTNKSVLDEDDK